MRVKTRRARIDSAETGVASWYGHPYHGRRAANGEIYDMEKDDRHASHSTLRHLGGSPNLDNDRKATVRITDRGPFIDGRIIDLSRRPPRERSRCSDPASPEVRLKVVAQPTSLPQVSQLARSGRCISGQGPYGNLTAVSPDQYGTPVSSSVPATPASGESSSAASQPSTAPTTTDRIRQTGLPTFRRSPRRTRAPSPPQSESEEDPSTHTRRPPATDAGCTEVDPLVRAGRPRPAYEVNPWSRHGVKGVDRRSLVFRRTGTTR